MRRRLAICLALGLLALLPLGPAGAAPPASCLRLAGVTIFAPRGEVYVELEAQCSPEDFEDRDSLVAHVEVLVSDLPPVSEDVRVLRESPTGRQTLIFDGLGLAPDQSVLVRLVRFGRILGLRSLKVL